MTSEELAAVLAALEAVRGPEPEPAAPAPVSRWRSAGRDYVPYDSVHAVRGPRPR